MQNHHKDTQAVHSAKPKNGSVNPVTQPIYLSTTYERNHDGTYDEELIYSRNGNPNRSQLQRSLSMLEGGEIAFAFSSGMAAITSVFQSLKTGDHVILPDDVYYKLLLVMEDVFKRWGLTYTVVDMNDMDAIKAAITSSTALIWMETPSNPMLKITDVNMVADIGKAHNIITAVDNTWSTPILLNPLALGADIVVHSTTKYFGGHSDVLGGAVICKKDNETAQRIHHIQVGHGAVPSPFDCWLITRGIQTLPLRIKAQSETAAKLAAYFSDHEKIEQVYYPGLPNHTNYEVAKNQMEGHYGAMLSITIKGGEAEARSVANNLKLFTQATSLGGIESLVEHRKSVEGPQSKTPHNLLRLSIGLEYVDDLIADFEENGFK